jgi:hypothetical protein
MSSGSQRDPMTGVIRQGTKVVGAILVPDASESFVREFNHCYGQLRMSIVPNEQPAPAPSANPNSFQLPNWFRHVWHGNVLQGAQPESIASTIATPNAVQPAPPAHQTPRRRRTTP